MMDEPRKPTSDRDLIGDWVEAIEAARKQEEDWRKDADQAIDTFRGELDSKSRHFNIYHSNIEIRVPSLYNSTPIPDVRRRFGDDDPVGRVAAEIVERSLSYCADAYAFDAVQTRAVYEAEITGRGFTRVRYEPEADDDKITSQKLTAELVPWDRFIRGPGVVWEDVPFIAFEHYLPREEVRKLNDKLADKIPYNYSADGCSEEGEHKDDTDIPKQFQRAKVYEVWDKRTREILFFCPEYAEKIIKREEDVLKLRDFFPGAAPMYAVTPVDSLVPVCPYTIYRDLLEELNQVSTRIGKLVKQLRPRAGYVGTMPDVKAWTEAGDGEIVPLTATDPMLSAGAIDVNRWLAWFPLEPTVLAIRQLLEQRAVLVQTIQEVTGMSDIMRGSTDPRETAKAQQLKSQFGSVRIRAMQAEVARHVCDTFRLKAQIIGKHFEWDVISAVTGIKLLPKAQKQAAMAMAQQNPQMAQQIAAQNPEMAKMVQAPSVEEVMELLRGGMMDYRIDIETDSTIRADLMRNQEQMSMFLQGTSQYLQAIGPMVKEQAIPKEAAVELYIAFTRQFQLGKSAEDALEKLAHSPTQPKQEGDDGKAAAQAAVQTAKIKAEADYRLTKGDAWAKHQIEQAKIQSQQQIETLKIQSNEKIEMLKAQLKQAELQLNAQDIQMKDVRERETAAAQIKAKQDSEMQQRFHERQNAMMERENSVVDTMVSHEHERESTAASQQHELKLAKAKPKAK